MFLFQRVGRTPGLCVIDSFDLITVLKIEIPYAMGGEVEVFLICAKCA